MKTKESSLQLQLSFGDLRNFCKSAYKYLDDVCDRKLKGEEKWDFDDLIKDTVEDLKIKYKGGATKARRRRKVITRKMKVLYIKVLLSLIFFHCCYQ